MSKAFQHKHADTIGNCLSLDELTKYVNGELTEKEKFSFEKHLVDCELCTDAIEGFSHMADSDALNEVIDALNDEISSRSGYKPARVISFNWRKVTAIAAMLLVLAGVGYLVNGLIKHDGSLAWTSPAKQSETVGEQARTEKDILNANGSTGGNQESGFAAAADKDEQVSATDENSGVVASENEADAAQFADADGISAEGGPASTSLQYDASTWAAYGDANNESRASKLSVESPPDPTTDRLTTINLNASNAITITDSEESASENKEVVPSASNLADVSRGATAPDADGNNEMVDEGYVNYMKGMEVQEDMLLSETTTSTTAEVQSKKKAKVLPSMESAMTNYNNTEYKAALSDFEVILENNPNNRKATYHAAVSNMNLGKNNKALPYFDNLIDNPGTYTESSKWLKAQILVKKNKTDDARSLLQEIANGNSKYSDQAFDLLQKL